MLFSCAFTFVEREFLSLEFHCTKAVIELLWCLHYCGSISCYYDSLAVSIQYITVAAKSPVWAIDTFTA